MTELVVDDVVLSGTRAVLKKLKRIACCQRRDFPGRQEEIMQMNVTKSKRGPTIHWYGERCGVAKRILSQDKEELPVCDRRGQKREESYEMMVESARTGSRRGV